MTGGGAPVDIWARLRHARWLAIGNAPDQGMVADEPEGLVNRDRREGGEPRSLRRCPIGRGRYSPANVPGDFAADRGTTAAASTCADMRRSIIMCSTAIDGRSAPRCQRKWPDQP